MSNIVLSNHASNGDAWKQLDDLAEATEKKITLSTVVGPKHNKPLPSSMKTGWGQHALPIGTRSSRPQTPSSLTTILPKTHGGGLPNNSSSNSERSVRLEQDEVDALEDRLLDILTEAEDLCATTTESDNDSYDNEQEEEDVDDSMPTKTTTFGFEADDTWKDFCDKLPMEQQQEEEEEGQES